MQSSSSGGRRNPRSSRPRGEGRSGGRPRSRNPQSRGPRRSDAPSDGPDEFRPSEHSRGPRRESVKPAPAPQPTAFQKFIKLITFGLVDLAPAKAPAPARKPSQEGRAPRGDREGRRDSDQSEKPKRERRPPSVVEPTSPRLYVGNLSYDVTDADLQVLFAAHGSVVEAAVVTRSGTDRSKGFAFVEMGSLEEAKAAASALNDHELQGRKMLVTGAKSEGRADESTGERAERPERPERSERVVAAANVAARATKSTNPPAWSGPS